MTKFIGLMALLVGMTFVAGCSGGGQHEDLHNFMAEVRSKPSGEVKPLPTFRSYKTFKYGAMAMRSPFEPPLTIVGNNSVVGKNKVQPPNNNRKKEYLESYNFAGLSMVGALSKDGQIWSLVNDGGGGIHRVTTGNYMGKNHGRIVMVTNTKVDVVEVVPDGKGEWVQRPRTLALKDKE
jgi:type IV pilus assembly protein PilP